MHIYLKNFPIHSRKMDKCLELSPILGLLGLLPYLATEGSGTLPPDKVSFLTQRLNHVN